VYPSYTEILAVLMGVLIRKTRHASDCAIEDFREKHSSRMEDIEFAPAVRTQAGEARYDSPEVVSCGVPPKERAASTGRR
jgi:hypothetical protein